MSTGFVGLSSAQAPADAAAGLTRVAPWSAAANRIPAPPGSPIEYEAEMFVVIRDLGDGFMFCAKVGDLLPCQLYLVPSVQQGAV